MSYFVSKELSIVVPLYLLKKSSASISFTHNIVRINYIEIIPKYMRGPYQISRIFTTSSPRGRGSTIMIMPRVLEVIKILDPELLASNSRILGTAHQHACLGDGLKPLNAILVFDLGDGSCDDDMVGVIPQEGSPICLSQSSPPSATLVDATS